MSEIARSDLTHARVGLGRTGVSMTTHQHLLFQADHAAARDAVHAPFDAQALAENLQTAGIACLILTTGTTERSEYLRRPDLGRRLSDDSRTQLASQSGSVDVALIISDGLSATAASLHACALVTDLVKDLGDLAATPVLIAGFARVGLLSEIGGILGARAAAIIIGERPGLSAPDGLSVYVEVSPAPGHTDADRNCISNIRPSGLPIPEGAARAAALIRAGLRQGVSGTALKVEYDDPPAL